MNRDAAPSHDRCQACASELKHRLFCDHCEKIQQMGKGDDYFSIFGHKKSFKLDKALVEETFDELILALHPDFHATAEAGEQALSIEHTALLHQAKNALFNPYLRGRYLLTLLVPEIGASLSSPPQSFIIETFELQEALDEAAAGTREVAPLSLQIEEMSASVQEELSQQFGDLIGYADQPELVEAIQGNLAKLKFLLNLSERAQAITKNQ
ncbi:MAG: iron-sulfur cluster co-chaperone HscB C-terminal domain-containing protein [bacterium]|nr:iron-sulfur cluster co-chaperone HscB C-terminal domain-containing protein [bacterium]